MPTNDGGWYLGGGSTWEYECETWAEATLFRSAIGDLELVVDHFAMTNGTPGFRRTFTGEAGTILAGVLNLYGSVPSFVEEALESIGPLDDIRASYSGQLEMEHERLARLFRALGPGHRRAVMALVEALGGLDGDK